MACKGDPARLPGKRQQAIEMRRVHLEDGVLAPRLLHPEFGLVGRTEQRPPEIFRSAA